jgi:predicted ferric reductase
VSSVVQSDEEEAVKKSALLILMGMGTLFPVVLWAAQLPTGKPWTLYLYSTGQLLALVGFTLLLYQYILSSRIKGLEGGIGRGKLVKLHRTLGVVGLVMVAFHPVFIFLPGLLEGYGIYLGTLQTIGVIALGILIIGSLSALLGRALKWKYKVWINLHRINYVVLPAAFIHSFLLGSSIRGNPLRVYWIFLGAVYLYVLANRFLRLIQSTRKAQPEKA